MSQPICKPVLEDGTVYTGRIVTMTYPLIGNYGITPEDIESAGPKVEGFVIKELAQRQSNFRATGSLDEYLKANGVVGIEGVDTDSLINVGGTPLRFFAPHLLLNFQISNFKS